MDLHLIDAVEARGGHLVQLLLDVRLAAGDFLGGVVLRPGAKPDHRAALRGDLAPTGDERPLRGAVVDLFDDAELVRELRDQFRRRTLLIHVEKALGTALHRGEDALHRCDAGGRILWPQIGTRVDVLDLVPGEVLDLLLREFRVDAPADALEIVVVHGDGDTVLREASIGLGRHAVSPAPEEGLKGVVRTRGPPPATVDLAAEQPLLARNRSRLRPLSRGNDENRRAQRQQKRLLHEQSSCYEPLI